MRSEIEGFIPTLRIESGAGTDVNWRARRTCPVRGRAFTVADAPLHNNLAERCLKKVVLHRKNSLFYGLPSALNGAVDRGWNSGARTG